MIGDGPERLFIQQLVRELKLGADVHFLGEQDQLEPLFFCADLFLLPSEQESFGLTALEAMNCGVPVIATDVGGLPEVITHGETGYLFPVGDIADMAASAVGPSRRPGPARALQDAGPETRRGHFSTPTRSSPSTKPFTRRS